VHAGGRHSAGKLDDTDLPPRGDTPTGRPPLTNGVDFFTTTGAADPPYAFANFKLESTNFRSGVPTMSGYDRS
jgi:hypothetical protein